MKKLLLSALLVLLAAALHAQEFYRITDIDDGERALEVSAVSYLDASENRFGAQVAYEIKPLTAYFEVSFFSERLGEEYGSIKYKAPSVSSKRLVKVKENGFIAGLKLGARLDLLDRVFVKAAVFANTTNWDRSIGSRVAKGARRAVDAGANVALGLRF